MTTDRFNHLKRLYSVHPGVVQECLEHIEAQEKEIATLKGQLKSAMELPKASVAGTTLDVTGSAQGKIAHTQQRLP